MNLIMFSLLLSQLYKPPIAVFGMNSLTAVVLSALLEGVLCRNFPPNFKFGAASAAYQVEGSWNVSDKTPNIWDTFTHTHPEKIIDGSNGDVACDSYNQWRKDIQIACELGLDFYRFSLSWTRILPNGFSNKISKEGSKFYSDFIDGLLERGIEPVVTLYHWDLPQSLQDLGGWTNPLVSDWFADYARVVYTLYADRVKTWITINEPLAVCDVSYNLGIHAPGIISPGIGSYLCSKHALLAHAKAWRIYDKEFRPKYNGKISLTNQIIWLEGADENEEEGAELVRQLMAGMYSHAIFSKEGGWPKDIEKIIAKKSKKEGYSKSRLPKFTKDEIHLIKGTYDFYGVNYYTARTVSRAHGEPIGAWPLHGAPEVDMLLSVRPEWPHAATSWFYVYPEGIRKLLSWLKEQYGDIEFFIAENGFASFDTDLEDHDRVDYYKRHLEQVLLSIYEDDVNIVAYTAWTMIDDFEWNDGYRALLGGVLCKNFPPNFKFGAASAAYQVEGSWNVSDKSPNIWDTFTHTYPEKIIDGSNGDVACDSYNQWRKDIQIAYEMGLDFYRFSLSWTRILPNGFSNNISEEGSKFYSDFIDGLLEKGIEPVVTLYHWDLPQSLQDLGGWTNPLVSDWLADYARVVYTLYADRVKTWITINEPLSFCDVSYNLGIHAPGIISPGIGNYLCNKHALLAHAKAWRIYDQEFRPKYNGKISLTNQIMWLEGDDENEEEGAELARQLMAGMYSHAIFSKEGGWPKDIEKIIAKKSKKEGYSKSRLPKFTKDEIHLIKGTYDFYGINYYTSRTVRRAHGEPTGPWPALGAPDIDIQLSVRPEWPHAGASWFYVYPEGIRKLLSWLKEQYGDIEFFIAENGFASFDTDLEDHDRVDYYKRHLEQVLLSIYEDDVNIVAYSAWTMMDNFEWNDGYRSKFGLCEVDFNDPARTRRPRASAKYYASVIESRSLDVDYNYSNSKLSDKF